MTVDSDKGFSISVNGWAGGYVCFAARFGSTGLPARSKGRLNVGQSGLQSVSRFNPIYMMNEGIRLSECR